MQVIVWFPVASVHHTHVCMQINSTIFNIHVEVLFAQLTRHRQYLKCCSVHKYLMNVGPLERLQLNQSLHNTMSTIHILF